MQKPFGPAQAGQDVKKNPALYCSWGEMFLSGTSGKKAPWETWGRSLGFWNWGYKWPQTHYTPTKNEILAAYEGIWAAFEVVGTDEQLDVQRVGPLYKSWNWCYLEQVNVTYIHVVYYH